MALRDIRMLSPAMSRYRNRRTFLTAMAAGLPLVLSSHHFPALAHDSAATATPRAPATSDEVIALAEAYFDAFNTGDAEALGDLLADDYAHRGAVVSQQDKEDRKSTRLNSSHSR